jgi:hypothetical protein
MPQPISAEESRGRKLTRIARIAGRLAVTVAVLALVALTVQVVFNGSISVHLAATITTVATP